MFLNALFGRTEFIVPTHVVRSQDRVFKCQFYITIYYGEGVIVTKLVSHGFLIQVYARFRTRLCITAIVFVSRVSLEITLFPVTCASCNNTNGFLFLTKGAKSPVAVFNCSTNSFIHWTKLLVEQ